MAKQKLREVTGKGNCDKVCAQALAPNCIADILGESFMAVASFQRILQGVDLSGGEHEVNSLDVATVLEVINTAARNRAQELLENAAGVPC